MGIDQEAAGGGRVACASVGMPDTCVCCSPQGRGWGPGPWESSGERGTEAEELPLLRWLPPLRAFFLKYSNDFRRGAGEGEAEIPFGDERAVDNEATKSAARPPPAWPCWAWYGTAQHGMTMPFMGCPMPLPRPRQAQPQLRHPNLLRFVPSLCCVPGELGALASLLPLILQTKPPTVPEIPLPQPRGAQGPPFPAAFALPLALRTSWC